jgi:hypothetical protein
MTDRDKNTPPHICPHCGYDMLNSAGPVQWCASRKGYEHVRCAASVPHAA